MTIDALLLGESPAMRELRGVVHKFASSPLPVLVRGPRGAGKELVARALHATSGRTGAFVAFNVCAIPDTMFEDTLFGHVRGAFTGATHEVSGFLAEAHRGSVLFDEVGGLSLTNQRKLLRVVETRQFRPVGARADRVSDFRVIAATNDDLESMIRSGTFRGDLADRFGVLVIDVPSLSNRLSDVPLLTRHFAKVARPASVVHFTDEAVYELMAGDWPGNVRQLRLVVERAVMLSEDGVIDAAQVCRAIGASAAPPVAESPTVFDFGQRRLLEVLERVDWNVHRAAFELQVDRSTIYRRLRRIGISGARGAGVAHDEARTGARRTVVPRNATVAPLARDPEQATGDGTMG